MSINTVSTVAQPNWQLIATNTTTSGTSTTFSGLSGYKKYLVTVQGVSLNAVDHLKLTFNGSTSSYMGNSVGYDALSSGGGNGFKRINDSSAVCFALGNRATDGSSASINGYINIDNLLSGPKIVFGAFMGNEGVSSTEGAWFDTSEVTSMVVATYNGNSFTAGTVKLYGIAA